MQVGDLVRYRYDENDVGIIIDTRLQHLNLLGPRYKVLWTSAPCGCRWMRPAGLEIISASR